MKNAGQPDQDFDEPSRADATAGAPGYPSSRRLVEDHALERHARVVRRQTMEQRTADPVGVRLPDDIISEMEAALKQQVDRLVAKRH
ncbi:hypothetical protein FBZ93_11933 [Bradyrhizobium macuxiense]|uniref:Uncharacterized protein n=1 Tax=Bradyrhizobium macuxiense TaxID=1755647 RepID=A0A560L0X4_9BRAD|nr:hypothetical protein [Bradyrhizobium macuxiense]TWB88044.1 hypothetical protein FBZ93_11933 [Bradyrhizobium macuxiense]